MSGLALQLSLASAVPFGAIVIGSMKSFAVETMELFCCSRVAVTLRTLSVVPDVLRIFT